MAGEVIVPRVHGSETEFGFTVRSGTESIALIEYRPKGIPQIPQSKFLRNGSKNYLDIRYFPEHATAECPTLEDLISQEIIGEDITTETYVYNPKKDNDPRTVLSLHKRSIAPDGSSTAGAHENYLTVIDIWSGENRKDLIGVLATHNATRTVFSGAGHPMGSLYRPEEFALAQKMLDIEVLARDRTTQSKPLINLRGEHHDGGNSRYKRFHNTSGDALISPRGIIMKHGTMSIVLRLLEHGIAVDDLTLHDPVASAHFVAMSADNLDKPLLLNNGKSASALDIQEGYIKRAGVLAERGILPEDELRVLEIWKSVIDDLRTHARTGDHMKSLEWIDWYTKRDVFEGFTDKHGPLTKKQFRRLVLRYDQTIDGIGVKMRRPGGRFSLDMPPPDVLEAARLIPPEGRSAFRGEFIERAAKNRYPGSTYSVNWGEVSANGRSQPLPIDGDYSPDAIAETMEVLFMRRQQKAA